MYKNKNHDGTFNVCGQKIKALRKSFIPTVSQRALADMRQLAGMDIDKNAIQRIESGNRFVTDIELKAFSNVLHISVDDLLDV